MLHHTDTAGQAQYDEPPKRRRSNPAYGRLEQEVDEAGQEFGRNISASQKTYISHWAQQQTWPQEYYRRDKNSMHHLLARQRSLSEPTFVTSVPSTQSDQRPRAEKSAPYQDPSYTALLETLGNSYMYDSEQGITDASKALCRHLLASRYTTPKDTLFREDVFPTTCWNLQDKNEARVILDIARLLAPSPEALVAFGAKNLEVLVESVNEG